MSSMTAPARPTWLEDLATADASWIVDATGLIDRPHFGPYARRLDAYIALWLRLDLYKTSHAYLVLSSCGAIRPQVLQTITAYTAGPPGSQG